MNRILLCAGVLLLITSPLAAQSKVFERTVSLAPGGLLRLDANRGSVRLTGWDRDQVEIRARIEAESSWDSEYARRVVAATTVDVVTSVRNEVVIRGNYENVPFQDWIFSNGRSTPNIHYEIRAPRRVDLRLNIDRSNSVINSFDGRIDLEADRSVIDASDWTGPIRIGIDRGGDSTFRNIRGSITVEADRTNLRMDLARLDASSRIEIDRGDIDMSLARGQGVDLDTSLSRRATFDTDLPIETKSFRRSNPSGAVNGGGPGNRGRSQPDSIALRHRHRPISFGLVS
jgi:hypothetical protein